MLFTFFDVFLIILLSVFVSFGLFFGLIHTFGALVGVIFGAWAASHYFLQISAWIANLTGISNNIIKVVIFIFLFILVNRLIGLIFCFLDKLFHFISIIPFLKTINKLAGAFLGLLEGGLVLGLCLYILSKYSISTWLDASLKSSQVASALMRVAKILLPLIPAAIKTIKGIF